MLPTRNESLVPNICREFLTFENMRKIREKITLCLAFLADRSLIQIVPGTLIVLNTADAVCSHMVEPHFGAVLQLQTT